MSPTAKKVTVVGSGNWGCAIAKIIAQNTAQHAEFHDTVSMWMFEEQVEHRGVKRKLSEVFNEGKENIKYLPGIQLPQNIMAEPDVKKAVGDADILVWVLPHQFVPRTVQNMGPTKPGAILSASSKVAWNWKVANLVYVQMFSESCLDTVYRS
jgi:glycerol-3-phosphate dehydrogenase (NAD+)